jgi:hypothetical protein
MKRRSRPQTKTIVTVLSFLESMGLSVYGPTRNNVGLMDYDIDAILRAHKRKLKEEK